MAVELLQQWAESHFPCKISNTLLEQVSLSALPEQCRTLVSQMCHTRSRQCHCYCPPHLSWCFQMCTKVTRVLCSSETKTRKNPMRLGQSQLRSESCLPTGRRGPAKAAREETVRWHLCKSKKTLQADRQMALRPAARCTICFYSPSRGAGSSFLTTSCINELFNV